MKLFIFSLGLSSWLLKQKVPDILFAAQFPTWGPVDIDDVLVVGNI